MARWWWVDNREPRRACSARETSGVLALSTLLALGVLIAGVLLPGWCLFSLLGLKSVAPALALPAAIGMGLSVESVAAWLAWLSGTGMIGAAVLTLLATAGAVGARIVWRNHAAPLERPGRFELGAAALAAVAIGCVVVSGPWLVATADTFYHMAAARDLLLENRAIPQVVFFGGTVPYPDLTGGSLQLVLGWLSLVSGMIPAWAALAFFGAPFTTVCLAVFAREITRSTSAAVIATALYLVVGLELDMRAAGYPRSIADGLAWLSLDLPSALRPLRLALMARAGGSVCDRIYSGVGPLRNTAAHRSLDLGDLCGRDSGRVEGTPPPLDGPFRDRLFSANARTAAAARRSRPGRPAPAWAGSFACHSGTSVGKCSCVTATRTSTNGSGSVASCPSRPWAPFASWAALGVFF